MNARKYLSFLMPLVCAALCLMLAAVGFSEIKAARAENAAESVKADDAPIQIKPSEEYYQPLPEVDRPVPGVISAGGTTTRPVSDDGANAPEAAEDAPVDPAAEAFVTVQTASQPEETNTAEGIGYLVRDGVITIVRVSEKALKDGALVIPKKLPGIQGTVGYIYADAFAEVKHILKSVTIPDTVTFIWNSAFAGCDTLETIHFGGSERQWQELSAWLTLPEGCSVECE